MKSRIKYFIFGCCRSTLGRLLPHSTKDIMFLDCTISCANSGESRKPFRALHSNRQSRNVLDYFKHIVNKPIFGYRGKGAGDRCTSMATHCWFRSKRLRGNNKVGAGDEIFLFGDFFFSFFFSLFSLLVQFSRFSSFFSFKY